VYSYKKPDRKEHCVVFWDTKTDERYTKFALSRSCDVLRCSFGHGNVVHSGGCALGTALVGV
jgi:hypothetical protein